MKRHVLVLGAGFGGLELATRLSETVPDAVNVTCAALVAVADTGVELRIYGARYDCDSVLEAYANDDAWFEVSIAESGRPAAEQSRRDLLGFRWSGHVHADRHIAGRGVARRGQRAARAHLARRCMVQGDVRSRVVWRLAEV